MDKMTAQVNRNIIRQQNALIIEKLAIIKSKNFYIAYQDRVIKKLQSDIKTLMMRNRN